MSWLKKIFSRSKKDIKLVMIGLDNAGKTTILNYLKAGITTETIPTVGVNHETFKFKKLNFNCYDIGGQVSFREFWKEAAQDCNALIFVVDSSDKERLEEAKDELNEIISKHLGDKIPIMIFSNKIDLPNHATHSEIVKTFDLPILQERNWHIQETSAKTGDGFLEGFIWLYQELTGEKIQMKFVFSDLIIFDKDKKPILNTSQVKKFKSNFENFMTELKPLLNDIIEKKLESLVIKNYKYIFQHDDDFSYAIIMKSNESEHLAKKTLEELQVLIKSTSETEREAAFSKFIKERI
ncbi:MAG: ADP-ribosylation factor family protein [Candidatus Helarchaeota archaeon]